MALPKKNKKNINVKVVDPAGGPKNWVDQFLEQNKQFLPRDVDLTDLDKGFIEFVEKDLSITIDGEKVSSHFLTLQRWAEFTRLWPNTDKYNNLKIPFISIVRRPNPEVGTNPADFKIPVRKNFPYMAVPIWDGNRKGADIYTIPNPVGVDMFYTVRFLSYKMRELNDMHKRVLQTFASAQAYVNIKGHYFPIMLESIGDESQIEDLNGKRYYVQTYEMKLMGYIVDSEEFEVKPAISRLFVTTETETKRPKSIVRFIDTGSDGLVRLIFQFLPSSSNSVSKTITHIIEIESIKLTNISSYILTVNGDVITTSDFPYKLNVGDVLGVTVVKTNPSLFAEVEIFGNKNC